MIAGSESASLDNNYEIGPPNGPSGPGSDGALTLTKTGTYRIGVTYRGFGETSLAIGVTWSKTRPYSLFLPLVRKSSATTSGDGLSSTNPYPVPGADAAMPTPTPTPTPPPANVYPAPPTATRVPPTPTPVPPTPTPSPTLPKDVECICLPPND